MIRSMAKTKKIVIVVFLLLLFVSASVLLFYSEIPYKKYLLWQVKKEYVSSDNEANDILREDHFFTRTLVLKKRSSLELIYNYLKEADTSLLVYRRGFSYATKPSPEFYIYINEQKNIKLSCYLFRNQSSGSIYVYLEYHHKFSFLTYPSFEITFRNEKYNEELYTFLSPFIEENQK